MINLNKAYISSDFHLFHTNVISLCNRPYEKSIDGMYKMNEDILKKVDDLPKDCEFLYLGDLFYDIKFLKKRSMIMLQTIIRRMKSNRKMYIILGNHDIQVAKAFKQDPVVFFEYLGFDRVYDAPIITKYFDNNIILSHKPIQLNPNSEFINVHGHTHDKIADEAVGNESLYYNVCLDYHNKILRFNDLFKKKA